MSIVNYIFDDKEYILNVDGDKYKASKSFNEFVRTYNLSEIMQADIDEIKEMLGEHGLSLKDLLKIKYETVCKKFAE